MGKYRGSVPQGVIESTKRKGKIVMEKDQKQEKSAPVECASNAKRCNPMFDNFFASQRPIFTLSEKMWNPPADVYETCDDLIVKMEIAGVEIKDLKIVADGTNLIIRGTRHEDAEMVKDMVHLMEIRYDRFERVFQMPLVLDYQKIEASYKNGFLLVHIPRGKEQPRHDVEIKIAEE